MNHKKRIYSFLMGVLSVNSSFARLTSVIEHRSQSSNNARKVAGEFGYVHLHDQDSWYARYASTLEYQRSFKSHKITRALFGCYASKCGAIKIQGSAVQNRADTALLADYFYLPADYDSVVCFDPFISDLIFDNNFYIGFNNRCLTDCYLRVYAPLVRSKWGLNAKEHIRNNGTDLKAGYFTPCPLQRNVLLNNFCDYLSGAHPAIQCATITDNANIDGMPNPLAVGDELASTIFHGLEFYRGNCCEPRTATTLADLRTELGWDFLNKPNGHLGINLQAAFPTGTRPNAQYMFNPVVGNGKHYEFGGGVTAHVIMWQCGDYEKSLSLNLDANITYMFANREQRTYDLVGKELSRFMLAAREGAATAVVGALAGSTNDGQTFTTPCGQFKYEYSPVANLTTFNISVKNPIQLDMALWLNYTNRNLSVDLGYDLWLRACDKVSVLEECKQCNTLCNDCNQDVWVLKGDAQAYGFVQGGRVVANGCDPELAIALSFSQTGTSCGVGATITSGSTLDNAEPAFGNLEDDELNREQLFTQPIGGTQVETSVSPIYINCKDIDFCPRNKGISNKIWTNIQWTWDMDRNCNPLRCEPFLGIGAEVEFGKIDAECGDCSKSCSSSSSCPDICQKIKSKSSCSTVHKCCEKCISVTPSQWGIWFKGGVNFE